MLANLRLAECESKIYNGIKGFYEAGKALIEIRDDKLFSDCGFSSFEEYCLKKWKFSRQQAYRLMDAYSVVKDLEEHTSPIGDTEEPIDFKALPFTESQARPLTKIKDPEIRAKVWQEVTEEAEQENKEVTAKAVEQKVKEYCNPCVVNDPMEFRRVTYLNAKYNKRFDELSRGEAEAKYLRAIVEAHCDNPHLLQDKLRFK